MVQVSYIKDSGSGRGTHSTTGREPGENTVFLVEVLLSLIHHGERRHNRITCIGKYERFAKILGTAVFLLVCSKSCQQKYV